MLLRRSTIFLGLMLTGSFAAAALVSGDEPQAGEVVAPVSGQMSRRAEVEEVSLPVLQLEKLARAEIDEPEQDPFAGKSWYVPPPPPPPVTVTVAVQEPPKPTAPPLPFGYMGRMQEEGGAAVVYLTQGARAYTVKQGDTLDGTYRVDEISRTRVALTYLPLDIKQTLDIGGAAAGMLPVASADSALAANAVMQPDILQAMESRPQ